ncbi:hypothetical protein [Bacillus sp. CD3-1a]|uniref:hypothetical protein n=2 Tax=Bacillus TaxID=1386 RepID=UPI001C59FB9C|nr:hypothetical protein [Bacillus sp. CD3-1a]
MNGMLSTVEGKPIYRVAYENDFNERMKNLNRKHYDAIVDELNKVIDTSNVHTSSWIPGHNWKGTVYQPIWEACKFNDGEAAKFYGQILYKVIIDRPEVWYFGTYPHARGKTYFRPEDI